MEKIVTKIRNEMTVKKLKVIAWFPSAWLCKALTSMFAFFF